MNAPSTYSKLLSDEVRIQGLSSSDVSTLWRRLARLPDIQEVALSLASSPVAIAALAEFAAELAQKKHSAVYRHPYDTAICAALVILEQSPLEAVRRLFVELSSNEKPSMIWIKRMAMHCESRITKTESKLFSLGTRTKSQPEPVFEVSTGYTWTTTAIANPRSQFAA